MIDFSIEYCDSDEGFKVKPKKNLKLDLKKIKEKYKVVSDAGIVVVIDYKGKIIVHEYGKLIFKDLEDEKQVRKIAEEIYNG